MKKYSIFPVLFFLCTLLASQERLTDMHTNAMTFNEISHEHLGQKYVVSIYPLDRLKLHLVVASDSATLLFEREFIGVGFFSGTLRFYKDYLLFQDFKSFYTYHLTTGKLNRFSAPEGFETYTNSLLHGDTNCLLKFKPPTEAYNLYYVLDYQNGISILNPSFGTPVCRSGDQFVFHSFYQKNGVQKSRYTLTDIFTNDSQIMVPEVSRQLQFYHTDEKFWYLSDTGQPRYFDPLTQTTGTIPGIAIKNYDEYQIYQQDSILVILSAKSDDYHILSYDVRNDRILVESKGKAYRAGFMTSKVIFHPTFLLCFDSGYSMYQFDYRLGMLRKYKVAYNPYPISDRIPHVAADVDYLYNGTGFTRIDFNTHDTVAFELNGLKPAVLTHFRTFQWAGQAPLIVLESSHQKAASCHKVDIAQKQVNPLNLLNHRLGLPSQARLLKVGTGMVLFADDLYQVKGRNLQKLNELPLISLPTDRHVPKYFTLRHQKLLYTTTDDTFIYVHEFDGKNNKYLGRLPLDDAIEDLVYFKGRFYVLYEGGKPYNLVLFDPKTQTSQIIDGGYFGLLKPSNGLDLSDYSYLYVIEDFVLYKRDSFFIRLKNDVPEVYHKAPIVCCVGSTITRFNGSWYLQLENDQHLYRMEETGLIPVVDQYNYINQLFVDEQNNVLYLIASANGQKTMIGYDGQQTVVYKSHPNLRQISMGDNHMLYKGVGRDTAYLFNNSEKRLYTLPALPEGEYYVGHSLFQNDTFVYAIGGPTYQNHLVTYELKHQYSAITPHYRHDSLFYASNFSLGGGSGAKLFFVGRYVLHQNGKGETSEAAGIRNLFPGSSTVNVPFDNFYSKGYLYFIAQDVEYGNQLFRMYLDETSFPDPEKKVNYALCPTLVDQKLTLTSPITDDIEVHYEIYSVDGRLVQKGFSTYNEVDATGLANGLYLITLKVPDGDVSLKFIKM